MHMVLVFIKSLLYIAALVVLYIKFVGMPKENCENSSIMHLIKRKLHTLCIQYGIPYLLIKKPKKREKEARSSRYRNKRSKKRARPTDLEYLPEDKRHKTYSPVSSVNELNNLHHRGHLLSPIPSEFYDEPSFVNHFKSSAQMVRDNLNTLLYSNHTCEDGEATLFQERSRINLVPQNASRKTGTETRPPTPIPTQPGDDRNNSRSTFNFIPEHSETESIEGRTFPRNGSLAKKLTPVRKLVRKLRSPSPEPARLDETPARKRSGGRKDRFTKIARPLKQLMDGKGVTVEFFGLKPLPLKGSLFPPSPKASWGNPSSAHSGPQEKDFAIR